MENEQQQTGLVQIVNESGLEKSKAEIILAKFNNFFEIAADWEKKARAIVVTSEDQKAEMKMAREGRLFLKQKRVEVENTRKELKEQALREGQTIDSIARILKNLIEPTENYLEQQEKFAEIQEESRRIIRLSERQTELAGYEWQFSDHPTTDLKNMSEEMYQTFFTGIRVQYEQRKEAERKAEEDRIAREKAEAEERERIRKENERLKKEAEEKEKALAEERKRVEAERKAAEEKARKEREAAEKKLAEERAKAEAERRRIEEENRKKLEAERLERERVEAELKAKRDQEEADRKRKDEEEKARFAAEKKAAAAPDKEKIKTAITNIQIQDISLQTIEGKHAFEQIKNKFNAFKIWAISITDSI